MKTKIAIDLNDVIRSYTSQFASQYKKDIDPHFDIDNVNIESSDLTQTFPFDSEEEYQDFVYTDHPYELFGCAEPMARQLQFRFHEWLGNDLRNIVDEDDNPNEPDVMLVSPFEINLTIQASLYFLHKIASRVREYYFPKDSLTIWDRCDILITANPWLLDNKPEGKVSIKIKSSYNTESEADYEFDSFMELMQGGTKVMEDILNKSKKQ